MLRFSIPASLTRHVHEDNSVHWEGRALEGCRDDGKAVVIEVDESDVLTLEWEDGLTLVQHAAALHRRWLAPGESVVPLPLPLPAAGRGGPASVLVSVILTAAGEACARDLAQAWDNHAVGEGGLYAVDGGGAVATEQEPVVFQAGRRLLLLVHGTTSRTDQSFAGLLEDASIWRRIHTRFDAVRAYDHHTLDRTPLDNALDLVDRLPPGARLHLLTQSRGGLVGDVLSAASQPQPGPVPPRSMGPS